MTTPNPIRPALPKPKPPRRAAIWAILTYGLWFLTTAALVALTLVDLRTLNAPHNVLGSGSFCADLVFNIWGLIAVSYFALLKINLIKWKGVRRLLFSSFAILMLMGRPFTTLFEPFFIKIDDQLIYAILFVMTPPIMLIIGTVCFTLIFLLMLLVVNLICFPIALFFSSIRAIEHDFIIHRYGQQGMIGYINRFHYWLRGETVPIQPDDSKGARFASLEEIISIWKQDGASFGFINNAPVQLNTNKHILIMASTRSGKGVCLIIPHLLTYSGSAFVLDPKGENARATGRQRATLNDRVYYLDPFGISGKPQARFNPLSRFTPYNMETESKALATALILGERDHWTASAQQLLAAMILFVYVTPEIPLEQKDLPTVRRLLLGSVDKVLSAMLEMPDANGLLADLAASFLKTPEKEFGSIVSTAQRETDILDNPFIVATLSATGPGEHVDFAEWHDGTMTVYLCLSAPKFPVFNRWLRLVLTSALDEMTDTLNPPSQPVCFMLDELATLGHLAAVENAVGLAAGYGVQLVTVFQDVAQMRDLYKGRWASFIGNAGIRAVFNLDDYDTAQYWSNFIGSHVVNSFSVQEDIYGFNKGHSSNETFRPLLSPEEIMLYFAEHKMLVLPQGSHPIITNRVPYFRDPRLSGLWDDPRSTTA